MNTSNDTTTNGYLVFFLPAVPGSTSECTPKCASPWRARYPLKLGAH